MNLYENAYNIIEKQYDALVKRKKKVLQDKDVEDLHQMRVAARKLGAALKIFNECVNVDLSAFVSSEIKLLSKRLGKVRDIDVAISYLQDYKNKYPEHSAVLFVIDKYRVRRKRYYKALYKFLKAKKFVKLRDNLSDLVKDLKYKKTNSDYETFLTPFYNNINHLIDEVYSFEKLKDLRKSEKDLHYLRISIKHLRYALEFLNLDTEDSKNTIKTLKQLQDKLGLINDLRVLNDQLDKILKKEKLNDDISAGILSFKAYNKMIKAKETKNIRFPWEIITTKEMKSTYIP